MNWYKTLEIGGIDVDLVKSCFLSESIISKGTPTIDIALLKDKLTVSILHHLTTSNSKKVFLDDSKYLIETLYLHLTNRGNNNKYSFNKFYKENLIKNFNHRQVDEFRGEYETFLNRIAIIAQNQKCRVKKGTTFLYCITPVPTGVTHKKLYISLDNTTLDNLNINLNFINYIVNEPPIPGKLSFKLPIVFDNFIKDFDNFIWYFTDPKDVSEVVNYFNEIPHHKMDRAKFLRADLGQDSEITSDTILVISEFIQYLSEYFDFFKLKIKEYGNALNNKSSVEFIEFRNFMFATLSKISLGAAHRK